METGISDNELELEKVCFTQVKWLDMPFQSQKYAYFEKSACKR